FSSSYVSFWLLVLTASRWGYVRACCSKRSDIDCSVSSFLNSTNGFVGRIPRLGLRRGLIYSASPVVFVHCLVSGQIPIFLNVASSRFSQKTISIERYRSTPAESSARASSSNPLAPQT